ATLLPSGVARCNPITPSDIPPGLVGLVTTAICAVPKLGTDSFVRAYMFDNTGDYATGLNVLNAFKNFAPTSPPVGCPTSNSSDNGTAQWGNSAFPSKSGQILECLTVGEAGGSNILRDYLCTPPTKNVVFEAQEDLGSTM